MSSSTKKKLRREQEAAQLTEKQLTEKKEAGKLKLYTIVFCAVIVLMVLAFVTVLIVNSGIIERSTTALTVGDHKISAVELNYHYIDNATNFASSYSSYASLFGLDLTKSLDSQVYNEEDGTTWADNFLSQAEESVRSMYALVDAANAAGYTLSEEQLASVDSTMNNIASYALLYGYSDTDAYLSALYGTGSTEKSYRTYCENQLLASGYYAAYQESLTYTDDDLRAAEEGKESEYSSFSYNSYYLAVSNFLEGGTTDEEGNTTYTDDERAAAVTAAEEAANSLLEGVTTIEELDAAIAALPMNAEKESAASTAYTDKDYSSVNSTFRDWVASADRKAGDLTVQASTTTDDEGNVTTNGYYVVYYVGTNDNTFPLANVRHILVAFEGGTTDDSGNTTYSDEEKAAALEQAEALLEEWKSGDATEDSFAELATANSADSGSSENGGLYEDVYPGQMVTNFNDWCFDEGRTAGDTGIVESTYGYHVMYYVGDSDTTYRDYMITNALLSEDMETWYNGLLEAITVTEKNVSKINRDLVLNASSSY